MAFHSPFLADAAERRSRALHRLVVTTPVLLLIVLGLIGHTRRKSSPQPSEKAGHDTQILAYRERVIAVAALSAEGPDTPLKSLEQEACRWVQGYRSGLLVAVPPAFYEDHFRDGVRGEILLAGLRLSNDLISAAEIRCPDPVTSARDGLLAAETAHGLRGSEIQALLQALIVQRRGVELLAHGWRALPPGERRLLRKRIAGLHVDPKEIDRMKRDLEKRRDDYQRRMGSAQMDEDPTTERGYRSAMRSVRSSNVLLAELLNPGSRRASPGAVGVP